jgi:hypothetical protein
VANGATSLLTAQATSAEARRAWPRWAALGVAMIGVAVAAVAWTDGGARLLLAALGLFLAVRGAVLLRAGGGLAGDPDGTLAGRARVLGAAAVAGGVVALGVAALSATLTGWVLLVAVPVVLLLGGLALIARGGTARRGGLALLVWWALVTGLLVVTGVGQSWDRAAEVGTVVTALAVAVLGVPMLVAAANLRAVGARPDPAPAPSGCGGCACGAGGCGSAG